jgi:hypothetical protein
MNIIEAQDLAIDIRLEVGGRTDVRQIGNGEWIVLYNYTVFVWNASDWSRYKLEAAK